MEDMNRKSVPIDSNVLCQKAQILYEDLNKGIPKTSDTKSILQVRDSRTGLDLKISKLLERLFAEASSTFSAELKKLKGESISSKARLQLQ